MTPDQPSPYGGPPAQSPYGVPAAPPPGPAGYGAPGYGAPGYGAPGYGAPGYGAPGYGAPGYGAPGYGAPWQTAPVPMTWPYGPGRPGIATAGAVMGFVTAGLTLMGSLIMLIAIASGGGDVIAWLFLLGIPCAAGMIVGGVRLLGGRDARVLLGSALAAVVVLLLTLLVGVGLYRPAVLGGFAVVVGIALVFPVITAALTGQRTVGEWVAARDPLTHAWGR